MPNDEIQTYDVPAEAMAMLRTIWPFSEILRHARTRKSMPSRYRIRVHSAPELEGLQAMLVNRQGMTSVDEFGQFTMDEMLPMNGLGSLLSADARIGSGITNLPPTNASPCEVLLKQNPTMASCLKCPKCAVCPKCEKCPDCPPPADCPAVETIECPDCPQAEKTGEAIVAVTESTGIKWWWLLIAAAGGAAAGYYFGKR